MGSHSIDQQKPYSPLKRSTQNKTPEPHRHKKTPDPAAPPKSQQRGKSRVRRAETTNAARRSSKKPHAAAQNRRAARQSRASAQLQDEKRHREDKTCGFHKRKQTEAKNFKGGESDRRATPWTVRKEKPWIVEGEIGVYGAWTLCLCCDVWDFLRNSENFLGDFLSFSWWWRMARKWERETIRDKENLEIERERVEADLNASYKTVFQTPFESAIVYFFILFYCFSFSYLLLF